MAKLCFHFYLPTKTTRFLTFCVYHIHNSRTSSQDILNYRFGYLFFYQDIQKTYINFFKSHFLLYLHVSVSSYVSCISSSNKFLNVKKTEKKLKFNLMSLGFNGQNFQVPSRTLNRVATVILIDQCSVVQRTVYS